MPVIIPFPGSGETSRNPAAPVLLLAERRGGARYHSGARHQCRQGHTPEIGRIIAPVLFSLSLFLKLENVYSKKGNRQKER
jgi:hypothetical protein